jgi:hypothetical protein
VRIQKLQEASSVNKHTEELVWVKSFAFLLIIIAPNSLRCAIRSWRKKGGVRVNSKSYVKEKRGG